MFAGFEPSFVYPNWDSNSEAIRSGTSVRETNFRRTNFLAADDSFKTGSIHFHGFTSTFIGSASTVRLDLFC
jgi:hypothetical protein